MFRKMGRKWGKIKKHRKRTRSDGEEKTFSNFLDFPPELRMMVINKMETENRGRFSGTSKLCNIEVKNSKNYVHGLELFMYNEFARITVEHEPHFGFMLTFNTRLERKFMKCENLIGMELWTTELESSIDLVQLAIQYFKNSLQMYQHMIKDLSIDVAQPKNIDFGITNLRNLEKLRVLKDHDVRQLLSKTRRDLEVLFIEMRNGGVLADCEQFYKVHNVLHSPWTRLNNEQFLRLSASRITINIGHLTEHDIHKFVRSWQNGTIGKHVDRYEWFLDDLKFDVSRMFRLFGEKHNGFENKKLEIKHEKETGKKARLGFRIHGIHSPTRMLFFLILND